MYATQCTFGFVFSKYSTVYLVLFQYFDTIFACIVEYHNFSRFSYELY